MTFGEARTILRNDVLAEASTEYYSDADLLGFLKRAAQELAYTFGFPRAVASVSLAVNQSQFNLPGDAANIDLQEVNYDGFGLVLMPYRTILHYVNQTSTGRPRYYNYDPKRASMTVFIAPKATKAGTVNFEYVQNYEVSSVSDSTPIWNGLFPAYHELVVFRAAVKAFDASLENERASYWMQREQRMSQEFSLFLNKVPLNRVMGEEVAES